MYKCAFVDICIYMKVGYGEKGDDYEKNSIRMYGKYMP